MSSGRVLVAGSVAVKSAALVAPGDAIRVTGPPARFVSRGGDKLDWALARFSVPVAGAAALDVGASTGGFTDCLLQHGAASVVAVDSGHGQLHPRLRADPRVTVWERTNARSLLDRYPERKGAFDVVAVDVSFISLRTLASVLVACTRPPTGDGAGGDLVLLVKPQFEAGRAEVSRGRGVVRHEATRLAAVVQVAHSLEEAGATVLDATASPVLGPAGNAEFLLHARCGGGGLHPHGAAERRPWWPLVTAAVAAAPDAQRTARTDPPATPADGGAAGGEPGTAFDGDVQVDAHREPSGAAATVATGATGAS